MAKKEQKHVGIPFMYLLLNKKADSILELSSSSAVLPKLDMIYELCYELLQKEDDLQRMTFLRAIIQKVKPNEGDLKGCF